MDSCSNQNESSVLPMSEKFVGGQDKVITLIDMDCFYCQVEVRRNPSLKGKPVAVVQYNTWKGGGIIAVNYEARNLGVTRFMRGDDAQKHCPTLELAAVPEVRGRADLSRYRDASREVMAILCEFCPQVEKASIDEAYLDLTNLIQAANEKVEFERLKNTFVVGYSSDTEGTKQWLKDVFDGGINDSSARNLAFAALLVEEIRGVIERKTGFHCSAGISHNKVLAKLACGLHKPNRQTVLPQTSVPILFQELPVKKVRNLGGKFGDEVNEQLDVKTMGEITKFSLGELQQKFGAKSGLWLFNIARGIDTEPVKARTIAKSIGCCKNFKGYLALATKNDVKHWLAELCAEIYERVQDDLITNKRRATLLTVSAHQEDDKSNVFSRSTMLNSYNVDEMTKNCFDLVRKFNRAARESPRWDPPLKFLGVSASKFVPVADSSCSLLNFFKPKEESLPPTTLCNSSHLFGKEAIVETISSTEQDPAKILNIYNHHESFFCLYFELIDEQKEKRTHDSKSERKMDMDVQNVEENEEEDLMLMDRCSECDQLVAIADLPEHTDYHAACKLHEELNGVNEANNVNVPLVVSNNVTLSWKHNTTKKKNKKLGKTRSDPIPKNRSIMSFFQAKERPL